MPKLESGIIVTIALASLLLLLLVLFLSTTLLVIRKKRLPCFRQDHDARPFMLADRMRHRGWKRKSKPPPFYKQHKKRKRKAEVENKNQSYHSLSNPSKFPRRDPFASKFLENPMVDMDEFDLDWTNLVFDKESAQNHDAAIKIQSWYRMVRKRIPFMQLKESAVLVQALFRGQKARAMLPRFRRDKAARDQIRKKKSGWKKQGTLGGLKYYDVKAFGFAEVEQLYGMDVIRSAEQQLRSLYGGKGKVRLKLFISIKGIKLYHYHSMEHFATIRIATVSFCTLDPKNRKIFAFINRKKRRNFCHVFQSSESDVSQLVEAQKMVETMAQAFEVSFRSLELKRKENEREKELLAKKTMFDLHSQQLDDEVQSMLEMAESVMPNIKLDGASEVASADGGSHGGSQEWLLPWLSKEEDKVEDYIEEDFDCIAVTLELEKFVKEIEWQA